MRKSGESFGKPCENANGPIVSVLSNFLQHHSKVIDPQSTIETWAIKFNKPVETEATDESLERLLNCQQKVYVKAMRYQEKCWNNRPLTDLK